MTDLVDAVRANFPYERNEEFGWMEAVYHQPGAYYIYFAGAACGGHHV